MIISLIISKRSELFFGGFHESMIADVDSRCSSLIGAMIISFSASRSPGSGEFAPGEPKNRPARSKLPAARRLEQPRNQQRTFPSCYNRFFLI